MKCSIHGKELTTDINGWLYVCPVMKCDFTATEKEVEHKAAIDLQMPAGRETDNADEETS